MDKYLTIMCPIKYKNVTDVMCMDHLGFELSITLYESKYVDILYSTKTYYYKDSIVPENYLVPSKHAIKIVALYQNNPLTKEIEDEIELLYDEMRSGDLVKACR